MLRAHCGAKGWMIADRAIANGELFKFGDRHPLIVKEEARWHVQVANRSPLRLESAACAGTDEQSGMARADGEVRHERRSLSADAIAMKVRVATMCHERDGPTVRGSREELGGGVWGECSGGSQSEMRDQRLRFSLHRQLNQKIDRGWLHCVARAPPSEVGGEKLSGDGRT